MKKKLINGVIILAAMVALAIPTIKVARASVVECPGGSCTFTQYSPGGGSIQWECKACCQAGQIPSCSVSGCTCTSPEP